MPLTEKEELELLELEEAEYQDSLRSASPLESAAAESAKAAAGAAPGLARGLVRSFPSAIGATYGFGQGAAYGAPLGPAGAVVGGLAGGFLGGFGGEAAQLGYEKFTGQRPELTAREALQEANIAGAVQAPAGALPVPKGLPKFAVRPSAQLMRITAGIPEKTGQKVFRDLDILGRATSIEEAGQKYITGTGGITGGVEKSRALFGKSYLSPEQAANAFDEMSPYLEALNPDEILTLRQKMAGAANETSYKQVELKRVLTKNIEELDEKLETLLPDWSGAKKAYREAKIGEEFRSWFPLNKNLSPNVLRGLGAVAAAGSGIASGNPLLAASLPFFSPRMWGYGIRAAATTAKTLPLAARLGLGYATSPANAPR